MPLLENDTLARSLSGLAWYARERGLMVSSAEVVEGVSACAALAPHNLGELQSVLTPCFVKSREDLDVFAGVFREYFYNVKTAPVTAVVNAELRSRCGAGEKKAEDAGQSEANRGGREDEPGWRPLLASKRDLPEPFRLYLQGDKHAAAARLVNDPLTDAGRKAIVAAFARMADQIGPADLATIRQTVGEYARLSNEVQKLRAQCAAPAPGAVHVQHADRHRWSQPAWFAADSAPSALLAARVDTLDKEQLALVIREAQRAAAAMKPFFARNPGTGRRRLALDYRRTMHASMATFGEPFWLLHTARHRRLRRLVTFCDVSGSVKKATGILLSFLFGLHQAFEGRARHFLFVSQVDEVTPFFSLPSYDECYRRIAGASGIDFRGYSNYGKALSTLWENHRSAFDYETVVLFLGDARSNRYDPRPDLIRTIQGTVRDAFFLNPEDPDKWGTADSAVRIYEKDIRMVDISRFGNLLRFLNRLPDMLLAR